MDRAGLSAGKRLDGWKAIAGYFNRDRTTVMRWARERHLPVRRMPGGSVFAFEHDLAAWSLPPDDPPPPPPPRRKRWPIAAAAAILVGLGGLAWRETRPHASSITLPADPAVARDYITARDRWARRTPADLTAAIRLYEGVIRRDPGFAPAHAGLAEAWLIIREYGGVDEPTAYRQARRHAQAAARLDPDLPAAHRALGFIDYWWNSRTPAALAHFRRALELDEHDAQTHFWHANILADIGDDAGAQRAYDRARLLSPGSRIIEVEQACSHWQAGRDRLALAQLTDLAARAPDDATIHNCLAWVHIARGDIVGFASALARRAAIRQEPHLLRLSAELDAAVARDPATAVRVLVADGRREIATGARQLRETPAFYASAMGDRTALVQLLQEANDVGERWSSAPVTRRIGARWKDDREVRRLLSTIVADVE